MHTALVLGCIALAAVIALAFWKGKQFLMLPQWARLSAMAAVAGGAFLLIHFAWKDYEKSEPTLVKVCWNTSGQAVYQERPDAPACETPEDMVWTKKTKKVYWALSAEYDVYRSGFEAALEYWNDNLDHEVLVETEVVAEADILIEEGSILVGAVTGFSMSTSHYRIGGEIAAVVRVIVPGNTRRFMLGMQHELGHCLGLAHDEAGIMHPSLPEPENRMLFWPVSAKDKRRLREVMGL